MTVFRIFPNSAHRSRLLYHFPLPADLFLLSRLDRRISLGGCHLSISGQDLCQPRLPLRSVASGLRHRRSAFLSAAWLQAKKNPPGRRLFPQCRHRHRSGTPDRMVSGYLLESALLGLQRLSFSFSWLYLPVRGGRFRHRGCALDLCAGGAAHQALETSHPQSAPWIKHPASAALCRRLRSCAHFPNRGAGITFP